MMAPDLEPKMALMMAPLTVSKKVHLKAKMSVLLKGSKWEPK